MDANINVLLSTLPGMNLPKTVCLPLPPRISAHELLATVASLLPLRDTSKIRLTTTRNVDIRPCNNTTLADIAGTHGECETDSSLLPLRITALLVGGKGGFGSQLRAAGGRMSSRKKRQNAELATGSARNLDGRRLRTITEAKNLATYLATKPDMDRKQKEERRKRWEQVIELAEQRETDMKAGKGADGRRKGLSDEWLEEKEEVGENIKNAVKTAMAAQLAPEDREVDHSEQSASESADDISEGEDSMELDEAQMTKLTREAEAGDADAIWVLKHKLKIPAALLPRQRPKSRKFAGFDDDFSSSSEGMSDDEEADALQQDNGNSKTALPTS